MFRGFERRKEHRLLQAQAPIMQSVSFAVPDTLRLLVLDEKRMLLDFLDRNPCIASNY